MPAEAMDIDSGPSSDELEGLAPLSSQRFAASRMSAPVDAQRSLLRMLNDQAVPIVNASTAATPRKTPAANLRSALQQLSTTARSGRLGASFAAATPSRAAATPRRANLPFIGPPAATLRASALYDFAATGDADDTIGMGENHTSTQQLRAHIQALSRTNEFSASAVAPPAFSSLASTPARPTVAPTSPEKAALGPPSISSIRALDMSIADSASFPALQSESALDVSMASIAAPSLGESARRAIALTGERRGPLASPPPSPARFVARARVAELPKEAGSTPQAHQRYQSTAPESFVAESTPVRTAPMKPTPMAVAAAAAAAAAAAGSSTPAPPSAASRAVASAPADGPTPSLVRSFISSLQSPAHRSPAQHDSSPEPAFRFEDFERSPSRSPSKPPSPAKAPANLRASVQQHVPLATIDAALDFETPAKRTRRVCSLVFVYIVLTRV